MYQGLWFSGIDMRLLGWGWRHLSSIYGLTIKVYEYSLYSLGLHCHIWQMKVLHWMGRQHGKECGFWWQSWIYISSATYTICNHPRVIPPLQESFPDVQTEDASSTCLLGLLWGLENLSKCWSQSMAHNKHPRMLLLMINNYFHFLFYDEVHGPSMKTVKFVLVLTAFPGFSPLLFGY